MIPRHLSAWFSAAYRNLLKVCTTALNRLWHCCCCCCQVSIVVMSMKRPCVAGVKARSHRVVNGTSVIFYNFRGVGLCCHHSICCLESANSRTFGSRMPSSSGLIGRHIFSRSFNMIFMFSQVRARKGLGDETEQTGLPGRTDRTVRTRTSSPFHIVPRSMRCLVVSSSSIFTARAWHIPGSSSAFLLNPGGVPQFHTHSS